MKDAVTCTVRLPSEWIESRPADIQMGEWIRQHLPLGDLAVDSPGNGKANAPAGLTTQQKVALKFMNDLFMRLFESGRLDNEIAEMRDEILAAFSTVQEMIR